MDATAKSSLSPDRKRLVELMQKINFGRIERLVVRDAEPIIGGLTRVVLEVKFGGENGPRPESLSVNFPIKAQIAELFAYFDQLRNGQIETLSVKHGLPFGMHVETTV